MIVHVLQTEDDLKRCWEQENGKGWTTMAADHAFPTKIRFNCMDEMIRIHRDLGLLNT